MDEKESFSSEVKTEISNIKAKKDDALMFLSGIICSQAGRDSSKLPHKIKIGEALQGRVPDMLGSYAVKSARKGEYLYFELPEGNNQIRDIVAAILSGAKQVIEGESPSRCFLRGIFLGSGYISNPSKMYRVEFHIANPSCAALVSELLSGFGIKASILDREGYEAVYFKAGDHVSDFLGIIGAVKALFEFENVRAVKEVNSRVSRTVNCDEGNFRRQTEAGASRGALIEKLMESSLAPSLPPELKEAARAHMDNPGASIAELGQLMDPPISKSGMSHRLQRLVELAKTLQ